MGLVDMERVSTKRMVEMMETSSSHESAHTFGAYPEYVKSGVKWLEKIPKRWEVRRLKFLLTERLQYGANEPAELTDPELPRYIRITDIRENGMLHADTFRSIPKEVAAPYLLKDGDVLFARSGATVGPAWMRTSWRS